MSPPPVTSRPLDQHGKEHIQELGRLGFDFNKAMSTSYGNLFTFSHPQYPVKAAIEALRSPFRIYDLDLSNDRNANEMDRVRKALALAILLPSPPSR